MNDYSAKPIEPKQLVAMLQKWATTSATGSMAVIPAGLQSLESKTIFDEHALLNRVMGDKILAGKLIAGFAGSPEPVGQSAEIA